MTIEATENINEKPRKAVKLKRIFFWCVGIVLLLFAILLSATHYLESGIKAKIIHEINSEVTVPVQVNGGIDLSLFRHFPYASLTFRQVVIDDRLQKGKKLLRVDEFSLLCNIYSLFSDQLVFNRVLLKGGELNMYRNEQGKTNFDIFKPATDSSQSTQAIQLKRTIIKNVRYTFLDPAQATDVRLMVQQSSLSGNFKQQQFDLSVKSKILADLIAVNHQIYLKEKQVKIDVVLLVDKTKKQYTFQQGDVAIEKSRFVVSGFFRLLQKATQLDFNMSSTGKDIQDLVALLPTNIRQTFAEADGSGEYEVAAQVKGLVSQNSAPSIHVSATLKNSELRLSRYNKFLKKVNATAVYELDNTGADKLVINNFDCTLNDLPFRFSLTLRHLADPNFDFSANGVLDLSEVGSLIPDSVLQDLGGRVTFNQFKLSGRKEDFTDAEHSTLQGSGTFKLEQVEFRQNGITYGNINGLLGYSGQTITANPLTLNFLSTDLQFTGRMDNLPAFVYNLSKKRNSGNVVLEVNGKLITHTFNLNGILSAYDKKNRPAEQQRKKIDIRDIFNMRGNLDVDVGEFLIQKMQMNNLSVNLQLAPGMIRINGLQTDAMSGSLKASGLVHFTEDDDLNINVEATAIGMDIPRIFRECSNFGQTTLTDKNLKGTLSAAVSMNATWTNYKTLDQDKLNALIDFTIKNGELIDFEPLKAASKFIRIEELRDIRFADLSNTIQIAHRSIDIPEFEIKSSALNLMFYGHHHFDNVVDYHFKINLHKILAQKFNRSRNDNQYVEEDPYEGVNLYLTLTGPLSNPKIKLDKPAVRNKIKEDFKKQKTEWQNLLHGKEAIPTNPNEQKREEKYFDVKQQPQFMDFDTSAP